MSRTLQHGRWTAEHVLPLGASGQAHVGDRVRAGDIVAWGVRMAAARRVAGARKLGIAPSDLERQLRAPIGSEVSAKTVLARVGRAFSRSVVSPIDGRLLHQTADGDLYIAPIVDRWAVRATLDGDVTRSDDAVLTIEGEAWCVEGVAAYGPDAVGELTLGVDGPSVELAPARLDVRLAGRIVIAGARLSAEVITRAHACGVAGLVAAGAPAAGLRVVYGETVTASGAPTREDRPSVLCLAGFGGAVMPDGLFASLAALAGVRAAINSSASRLFVFAPAPHHTAEPEPALSDDDPRESGEGEPAADVPTSSAR